NHFETQDENKSRYFPGKPYTRSLTFPISTFSSLTCLNDETRSRRWKIGVGAGTSRVVTAERRCLSERPLLRLLYTAVSPADNIRSDERRKLEKRRRLRR
ncbi:Uncharacterized protein DBV15_06920, partial [Temnothorax longispinosus]